MLTEQEILNTYLENRALKLRNRRLEQEVEHLHTELDRAIHKEIFLLESAIDQMPSEEKLAILESNPQHSPLDVMRMATGVKITETL